MQIKCTKRIAKEKLIFFSVSGRSTGGRWNGCPIWRNSLPAENNRGTDCHNGSASGVIKSQANDWRHSGFERKSAKSGPAQDKRRDAEEDSGGLDLRKKKIGAIFIFPAFSTSPETLIQRMKNLSRPLRAPSLRVRTRSGRMERTIWTGKISVIYGRISCVFIPFDSPGTALFWVFWV